MTISTDFLLADTPAPPYYAVIFSSVRTADDRGYAEMAERMLTLAAQQPGFLGVESAREALGITVSYWTDLAAIAAWKANVDHVAAQRLGHSQWYSVFKTRIAKVERDYQSGSAPRLQENEMSASTTSCTEQVPLAVTAQDVAPRQKPSIYPAPFAAMMQGRQKRVLGDLFGLKNFGVNLTELAPGAMSALRHHHQTQDEFIYILEGTPTLITNAGETLLSQGMCAGFAAGNGDGHQLVNRSDAVVRYLEVGDRSAGDAVVYPDNDLRADFVSGQWQFSHKDGTPY